MQNPIAKSLRIVFMGTPDFAVDSLKTLVEQGYNIVGVITAPDKPSGRGQKIRSSAVKQYAESQNLNILQPTNLKAEEFQKELNALNPELQIVVAFRMLPKTVWALPKFGTFNLHASLLPDYRGAAPIHWAIINGETETGVTTFFIDEKIDTGAILINKKTTISNSDTVGELHDKLMHLGSELIIETVEGIAAGKLTPQVQQDDRNYKTAYKLNRENCKIEWNQRALTIYNKIRGLNPFPTAWCHLEQDGKKEMIKIYKCSYTLGPVSSSPGSITTGKDYLKVSVNDGFINIYEMQLPGKRKMDVKSLLNGFQFKPNSKLS
ncbi:methionyl-tRNA formyltransferase [Winogradskyella aurantiaca]|uniref:methionyl-tRNA formyltransferase n=1 Tax=Winogradskyella aurantiaca TaxID=2219558 RepID=UPI000E1DCB60|nr:methionyl-tRNA formyltransferase [Winogradskyella aurantiaca]